VDSEILTGKVRGEGRSFEGWGELLLWRQATGLLFRKKMKKTFIYFTILLLNFSLYAQSIIKLNSGKINEENIYIVEDELKILSSKEDAEFYIEKTFQYLLQNLNKNGFYYEVLRKKENYSVQLFTRKDGTKNIVYLNFFILDYKAEYFNTTQVVVWDGGTNFWHISFDIQKENFYDIWINGF
jgi:hypothetical protein